VFCVIIKKKRDKTTLLKLPMYVKHVKLFPFNLIFVVCFMSSTFHVFRACPALFAYVNERNTLRTLSAFQHGTDVMFTYTVYSLSLNNLLLTCRGNPLATVLPSTDLQVSSKFQILYIRRTANVDYRAICRTSYSYLVPATFITAFIAVIDYNIT